MTTRVLVLGGYGNFGAHIVEKLAAEPDIQVIIAGRALEKAQRLAASLAAAPHPPEAVAVDIDKNLPQALAVIKPAIVIHTCGPFQGQGYAVAAACIEAGAHYVDLADGRDFVANIGQLNDAALRKNVTVISGGSSVPCLTAAVIDHYLPAFGAMTAVDYGITTAQQTNTGLATTAAVLGYAGKAFKTLINGKMADVYGWQGLTLRRYPALGWRLLGNCDVPDLSLFPARYPSLATIRFRAGLEIAFMHLGLWALTWLVRAGLVKSAARYARGLLAASRWFDVIGGDESGFHMEMTGTDKNGAPKTARFYIIARQGHGPFIPSTPAILCAQMLARGQIEMRGAFPCVGVITLEQYLDGLKGLDIEPLFDGA